MYIISLRYLHLLAMTKSKLSYRGKKRRDIFSILFMRDFSPAAAGVEITNGNKILIIRKKYK